MKRVSLRLGAGCAALVVAAGCGGDRAGGAAGGALPGRPRLKVEWRPEEAFRVGGSVQDTLLQAPSALAADARGVYVADPAAGRVLRFGRSGRLLFASGRPGGGPGEFRSMRDLEVDDLGRAWILDRVNARITILDTAGRTSGRIPLEGPARSADQLVPLPDEAGAVLVVYDRELPFARVGLDGRVEERFAAPWKGFADLDPLASQLVTASIPRGAWAAGFGMGDGFFVRDHGRWTGGRFTYVESIPFPRTETRGHLSADGSGRVEERIAEERPLFGALSATAADGRLFVLFGGHGEEAGRWLDIYGLPDGAYRGSVLLPDAFQHVAVAGGLLYGLADDPAPRLVAYPLPRDLVP